MCSGEEGIPVFSNEVDFSDLVIEEEIGHGSFGVVFKASYFGTPVAVKQIPQAQTEEEKTFLKREVAILQGVRHPNCVQFIGIATDSKGMLHLITDYISGGNLRKNLKTQTKFLSWNWRASISTDIAGAMAYLHSKNIIFRDLKSKNILIEGAKAKICDFGLARAKSSTTRPMTICGTDDWMAPEVILGMDYDTRADVFSFGIVLLEIITRTKVSLTLQRTPMDAFGLNEEEAHKLIPKDAPSEFTEMAFKCCAYEPEKRPTFKQLAVDFGKLAKSIPVEEEPKAAPKTAAAPKSSALKSSTPAPAPAPAPAPKPANTPSPKATTTPVAKPTSSLNKSSGAPATTSGVGAKSTPPKTAAPAPAPAPKGSTSKAGPGRVGGVVWPPPK